MIFFRPEHEIRRRINLLVKDYIDFTNDILAKYSFSRDGSILQLYIKRIRQLSHTEGCSVLDSKYCDYSENLHDLLVKHSQSNHNDYCLSFVFTYQHLSDSTLGLSWIANSNKGKTSILSIKRRLYFKAECFTLFSILNPHRCLHLFDRFRPDFVVIVYFLGFVVSSTLSMYVVDIGHSTISLYIKCG